MDIIFAHGWGFDAKCWIAVAEEFKDHNLHYIDMGFTGTAMDSAGLPDDALWVCHSLGLPWMLRYGPTSVRGIVSIGGVPAFKEGMNPKIIAMMKRRLQSDLYAQMQEFWQANGLSYDYCAEMDLKAELLIEGLDHLMRWDEREKLNGLDCPILVLSSEDDVITPSDMISFAWKSYTIVFRKDGGHALPLTRPDWCAEQIKGFLNDLS